MFKELYEKSLKLAAHKSSKVFLGIVSFIESSFFPIPPDIMIIPMVIAKKNDYLKIFLIATIFSCLGGLFGYFIGSAFLELSMTVIEFYGYEEKVLDLQNKMSSKSGIMFWLGTLFLAGFTPQLVKVVKNTVENLVLKTDFDLKAQEMIERKDEWHHLGFFEQSDWKQKFWGLPPENFKEVIWK